VLVVSTDDRGLVEEEELKVEGAHVVGIPKETLDFFKGDEIRARVFYEKYALKDEKGNVLEKLPSEMWKRVARELAGVETDERKKSEWYEKFVWLLENFRFVPGGRIMFGAGALRRATLLNCYVIPIKEDSIEKIFDWCKEAARTYSLGGGVGTDISILRPRGSPVNNSAVFSSGAVSFMEVMSETTHTIGQNGRRGALMITMSVDHPDVLEFIKVKQNLGKVRYANISIRITDEFMRAVEADTDFTLRFESKKVGKIEKRIKARLLWNELIKSARNWAEPGLIFWDTVKKYSPSEYNGMEVITTNPCSEQPLQPYGACDLGSLNLAAFVLDSFTDNARTDWAGLEKAVRYAMRFLDNVLDYNSDKHPLSEQAEAVGKSRRTGLGVTGLADMLAKLKIKYDSPEALAFVDKLFAAIENAAYDESTEIAKEKGPFPLFDKQKHLSMPFVKTLNEGLRQKIASNGLRNVALLTIPPVGSGSVLAGTSSGIEPIFAFSYTRRSESLSKEYFKVYHPLVLEYMQVAGLKDDAKLPDFFVPAHVIKPEFRVKLQGIIQQHIDSAISSTVNLPEDTAVEQVGNIYMMAWKAGCKGITVYREGSREGVLISDVEQKKKEEKAHAEAAQAERWKRPQAMIGRTVHLKMQQASLYVTVNFDENNLIREVFVNMGHTGSQEKSYTEAIGRLISKYLQLNGDVRSAIESLKGIKANDAISWDRGIKLYSVPDAIAKALEIAMGITSFKIFPLSEQGKIGDEQGADGKQLGMNQEKESAGKIKPEDCPECNEPMLVYESGCYTCKNCGYTKCS
jgi:ribonucleoside-diphosphate reductase alpha chain